MKLQEAFAEYTARTAFERPLMTGVAYAHKVLHADREEFERKQGWTIKTMHSKETSPVHEEYAPTIFSQETIGYLVSLDMMSGEVCFLIHQHVIIIIFERFLDIIHSCFLMMTNINISQC